MWWSKVNLLGNDDKPLLLKFKVTQICFVEKVAVSERACSKVVWQEGVHGAERDYKARAAMISGHCDSKGEPSARTP